MLVNIFMYQFDLLMKQVFAATERSIEEQEIASLALEPMVIGLIFFPCTPGKIEIYYTVWFSFPNFGSENK